GVAGLQDDLNQSVMLAYLAYHLFARHPGHEVVDEDQVHRLAFEHLESRGAVDRGEHAMPFGFEERPRGTQDVGAVVDHQDRVARALGGRTVFARHDYSSVVGEGKRMMNFVPTPASLSTEMSPLKFEVTMLWTMDRP